MSSENVPLVKRRDKTTWLAELIGKINRGEITPGEMKQVIHEYNCDLGLLNHLQEYVESIMDTIRGVRK